MALDFTNYCESHICRSMKYGACYNPISELDLLYCLEHKPLMTDGRKVVRYL